ncbi:Protein of unknown function [Gracilibacillus ureilyticus]|uniref:DUF2624 domain-containing protein n=1 Tax=Gracilibacillus ureilyticus TaxID=531814 RepID=A0A1H9M0Z4_9BACI|nr:DUF2624 family protein [Gracilibacillus ureilyticus]SER17356.1 Protein of unknown function [Gracilibacillus ureilyticus]
MNGFKKMILLRKLQSIEAETLYNYAQQYNISITKNQAAEISQHLKNHQYDPTKANDRTKMLKKLAQITDLKTAQKCHHLFQKLIKDYGLEDMFE